MGGSLDFAFVQSPLSNAKGRVMADEPTHGPGKYYRHIECPPNAPLGVRIVEFLHVAYSKDAPPGWNQIVVYRPLDRYTYVYKEGGWDFRPFGEFVRRYRPINDEARIAELDKLSAEMYDPAAWAEFRANFARKK